MPRKRSVVRIDFNQAINGSDLWLGEVFIFLETLFILRLDPAPLLCVQIFIEHTRVVVVPSSTPNRDHRTQCCGWHQSRQPSCRQTETCRAAIIIASPSE